MDADDFPVVWESEADRLDFWVRDNEHSAGPTSHLGISLGKRSEAAAAAVAKRFGLPFARPETRVFNGYTYRLVIGERASAE